MSDHYVAELWGGCLGPSLPDGTRLWVHPTTPIIAGGLCTVVLRKGKGPWDEFMRTAWTGAMGSAGYPNMMAKVFLGRARSDGRDVLLLGQMWPPAIGVIALDEVEAMHCVVGRVDGQTITLGDEEAFRLVVPPAVRSSTTSLGPINPHWRPPLDQPMIAGGLVQ